MRRRNRWVLLISILVALSAAPRVYAHEGHDHSAFHQVCENLVVKPSGRDRASDLKLEEYAKAVFGGGGVAERLGFTVPPHVLEFLTPAQIETLVSLSRHAVGHWKDGATVGSSRQSGGKYYEFVWPGCPSCRSFYDDTTNIPQQLSVMLHVAGHNDFNAHSPMSRFRDSDRIKESIRLDELMEKYGAQVGRDRVDEFYQHLLTLRFMQDYARGTYRSPEALAAEPVRTTSFLQGFVAYVMKFGDPWQKDIAQTYERMERAPAAVPSQKIMNEGWAVMAQYLLLEHSPERWRQSDHMLEYARLLQKVVGIPRFPDGSWNPYWLGIEGWRRLRERFNERPDTKNLDRVARDRKFVEYAHHITAHMQDSVFLKEALDETWIRRKEIFLARPADPKEVDPNLPPSSDPNLTQQYLVLSHKAEEVVERIVFDTADLTYKLPRIVFNNLAGVLSSTEIVEISVDNPHRVPLKFHSIAPTLQVLVKLFSRPVRIRGLVAYQSVPSETYVTLYPNGEIETGELDVKWSGFSEGLEKSLAEYQATAATVYRSAVEQTLKMELPKELTQGVVDHNLATSALATADLPNVSKAILAYGLAIRRLLPQALGQFVKGNITGKRTSTGVQFQLLPSIPNFEFDHEVWQQTPAEEPAQNELFNLNAVLASAVTVPPPRMNKKLTEVIGGGPKRKGERTWGPPRSNGGGGDGGYGKPAKSDSEKDEKGNNKQAGDQVGSLVEIPFDLLAKLLSMDIRLPNLRPRGGDTKLTNEEPGGARYFQEGDEIWDRIAEEAIPLGKRMLERNRQDSSDVRRAFIEGMKWLSPGDNVVRGYMDKPAPGTRAVVFMMMDMSSSMDRMYARVRDFVFNMKEILRQNYDSIEFRFIGVASQVQEFNEQNFFTSRISGGTNYELGVRWVGQKSATDFPGNEWDKFLFVFGDMETSHTSLFIHETNRLLKELQYLGVVFTTDSAFLSSNRVGSGAEVVNHFERLAENDPYVGFAELAEGLENSIKALHNLFKTKQTK